MKPILKIKEIDKNNSNFPNNLLIKTPFYLSSDKWFKGCRSRGLR
tara:strand:+ start:226 stop:360 length:135 start_codon:yes stop_codon:yes gene_type:complete